MVALSNRNLFKSSALLGFLLGCNPSGQADDETSCQPGTEFCECLGGTTCSGGLECVNGFCVSPGSDEETDGSDGSDDVDADASDTADTADTADTVDGTDTETGGMEEGGPMIVDFGTNVSMITEDETVVFTATVIDPDGPDDIQGGSLKNEDGSINFGGFTDEGSGTYTIELSWDQISQAQVLQFDGSESRIFRAEFFDNMGHMAWQTTDITFTCAGGCAWNGECPDTQNDDLHCGACNNACIINGFDDDQGHCEAGQCGPIFSDCVLSANPQDSCATVCAEQGLTCAGPVCDGDLTLYGWNDGGFNSALEQCESFSPGGFGIAGAQCSYPGPNDQVGLPGSAYRCCCNQD